MDSRRTVSDFYRGGSPSTPYYTAHPSPEPQSDEEQQPVAGPSKLTLDLPVFSLNSNTALQPSDDEDDEHSNLHLNINFNLSLDFSQATLGHSRPPSPAPTADFSMISPPSSPSYVQYHSQFLSPPQGRNTLPFFRTSPTRTSTHLRSHSIALGSGTKRRVRPNITKLWESISSPSPRGSKSSPTLKHPSPIHRHFSRSSPNILRARRKIKRPSVTDVFGCGSGVQGNVNGGVDIDYGALDPLDGEEGELVDHDGYFDAIQCDLTASPSSYTHSASPSPLTTPTSSHLCLFRPHTPSQAYTLCPTSYASASTSTFTSTQYLPPAQTSLPLPPELTLHILSLLPVRSVLACMLVSSSFYTLAKDTSVWLGVWKGREGRPRVRTRTPRQNPYNYPYSHSFSYGLGPLVNYMSSYSFPRNSVPSLSSSSSEDDSDSDVSSLRYAHADEGVHGFPLLEDSEDVEGDGPSGWAVDWDRIEALRHSGRSRGVFMDEEEYANRTSIRIPCQDLSLRRGTNLGPLRLNWHTLYRSRATLEKRWRDPRGEPRVMRIEGHGDSVYCLDFDSRRIITGSRDRTIKVWCIRTGECLATFEAHLGSVLCLKFEKDFDARRSFSRGAGLNGDEEQGGANEGEEEEEESHGIMVSGSSDCTVRVWDLHAKHRGSSIRADVRAILRGHSGGVLDLRMDENWIVSCSKDALINVYSRSTLTLHAVLQGHEGPVNAIGLEGGRVVSASGDGRMMLWDAASGRCLRVFEGHERGLACIEFKDDLILSGSNDCTIKLWRASTGECLHTFAGHTLLVRALCFDPRTGYVVSASYDRSVRVWEWREPAVPAVDVVPFSSLSSSSTSSSSSSTSSSTSSFHSMHTSTSTHTSNSTHDRTSIYAHDTDGASVVGVADGVVGYRNSGMSEKRGVGRLVREFRDLHASHIFDVKFDVGRIVSTSHDQKIVVLDFTDGIEGAEIFV
ncbi:WD40-repeat-containing domain protein [Suillus clintonianus]|uniref:WD40-repeat-containing domain protein n=1 Tax=Suillus clintonianus TaxID=1904413 RepID=UPI001B865706|nr:WD40-repeat-containing domain protein [Suillus clintonianus]KAG2126574.1 WD40-repeat-containing domain protein [Suillus clintonianus]